MGILIVRYLDGKKIKWGRLEGPAPSSKTENLEVVPFAGNPRTTSDLISAFERGELRAEKNTTITIEAKQLRSPITNDATLLCQGLNYQDHAAEAQQHIRKQNLFFAKASSSISGAYDPIIRPKEVELLDYEVEFGVVMRKTLDHELEPGEGNLGTYIAGVVLANDVSARDVMFGASFLQWFQGKSYRTFCPLGPVLYLLEKDEVETVLSNLEIKLWVNGELRQSAKSSQLIYGPLETLGQLSGFMNLKVGDVILTGTPGGVTSPASPKLVEILKTQLMADAQRKLELRTEMTKGRPFLKPGDVVRSTFHDLHADRFLGGQESRIVAG
ncbi:MAG: fumarylacetoacetate hydrolase [Nevskia sp.]|nr:fumarylacetoacetate hydrolase [Nevskia sp.]